MKASKSLHVGVWALAIAAFAIGVSEFVVVGVLPSIAQDFSISLAHAGGLVSYYALALAVGTPITILAISHLPKRSVLLILLAVFLAGNLMSALASNYSSLMLGRVVTAIAHGSFFAIGATVATRLAPLGQAGRAIALMFGGLTLAMVLGVPLGSLLGNQLGWRLPFYAVAAMALIALLAIARWIPPLSAERGSSPSKQLQTLRHPIILAMMSVTIFGFGASFATFTFITPLLTDVTGFSGTTANLLLMVFGLATLIGNLVGGQLASKVGWYSTLRWKLIALVFTLIAIMHAVQLQMPMVALLFVWGALAFGVSPALQAGMIESAERWTPDGVAFASALNISAFNLGISLGGLSGSILVNLNRLAETPQASIALALLAQLPLIWLMRYQPSEVQKTKTSC
ncbi:MFS transporter [Pseudomonas putida]|uniref:MFS transporter n=1 Tax=Pseudomonas putida TaxID=303 RepID=UPI001E31C215|nr:MFS transporter [Pseudomonas putida]MCC9007300.1 MFS transporter [Pseudomonas putida]